MSIKRVAGITALITAMAFVNSANDLTIVGDNNVNENDESYQCNSYADIQEFWDDEYLKDKFLHDCLDMVDIDSNAYSGTVNTIGFDIELDLETLHQEVEKATNKFKRYFNIEPELLLGVSVW